jgi:fluoride exporter
LADISNVFAIATGAVPGALSRFYLTEWTKKKFGDSFPIGTFVINLTGCLAVGFFFKITQDISGYPTELDLLIRTGFLGSYTTFSTYEFDTLTLWRSKRKGIAFCYWAGSAILGLAAVILGTAIASIF